jgi:hypothetical protein
LRHPVNHNNTHRRGHQLTSVPGGVRNGTEKRTPDELAALATAFNGAVQHINRAAQEIMSSLAPPAVEPGDEEAAEAFGSGSRRSFASSYSLSLSCSLRANRQARRTPRETVRD